MREVIGGYKNGNYHVVLLSDGTMIRNCKDDRMIPKFPDSMDIKITNKCSFYVVDEKTGEKHLSNNCVYCHENSGPSGNHGKILNIPFLNSLHKYTQLAIGGGNVLEHPDIIPFLVWCKEKELIPSITLNQHHFMQDIETVRYLVSNKLIYGLGVSMTYPSQEFINTVREFPNAVVHVIAGIVNKEEIETLSNNGLKMLILGYKQFRRGEDFYNSSETVKTRIQGNIDYLKNNIKNIINCFEVVSFDNLAIKQLDIKSVIPEKDWERFYMGDDGHYTMYVDTVNEEFAVSSTSTKRYKYSNESIEDMFKIVRGSVNA